MRIVPLLTVAVFLIVLYRNPVSAQVTYSKVVLSTEAAPGVGAGVTYVSVSGFSASASSQVVVSGLISGSGVTGGNDEGLWAGAPGLQTLLAREGDIAPGTGGATFTVLTSFAGTNINALGQVAFVGFLTGTGVTGGVNDRGFWSGAPGSVGLLARFGDAAPGTVAGVVFSNLVFSSITFNAAGHAAFAGTVSGTGVTPNNDTGIWVGVPGSVSLAVREGDAAPNTELSTVFSRFSNHRLNASGQIVFNATVTGPSSTGSDGIWAGAPGSVNLVARSNTAAPGTVASVVFGSIGSPTFNDAGDIAFAAELNGIVNPSNNSGIWARTGGPLTLVIREGDVAPGAGAGVVFRNTLGNAFQNPTMNAGGKLAFIGAVGGTGVTTSNDTGIWSGTAASLALVARKGDVAPGTSAGVVFNIFFNPGLNVNGQTAFGAFLTGAGVTSSNDQGIWAIDGSNTLVKIARKGDLFDVDPGPSVDLRTILSINSVNGSGNQDGLASHWTESNELLLSLNFSGSNGVFLASVSAVPEPSMMLAWSVVIIASGMFLRQRRLRTSAASN